MNRVSRGNPNSISNQYHLFLFYLSIFVFGYSVSSEKAMAPHSSTLVWKTAWTEEPGGLQSMGLLRVRHD